MAIALEEILGFSPLTTALRATSSGVPNPFPDDLFTVAPQNRVRGDRAKWIRITGERRTARRVVYGAPGRRRSLRDVSDQTIRCFHNHETFQIEMTVLQKLQAFEKYENDDGIDWVRYQLEEAAKRQVNTRIITAASMLRQGAIYWDSDGNLLPTSSGADTNQTVTANIPSSHQNQLGGLIDASWALANTDIPFHVESIQKQSLQDTGMRQNAVMYGINVPRYIRANNFAQAFMSRNPGMNDKMLTTNAIPDGLFNIDKWVPVYTSFFQTDDNTVHEIWDDDLAVFMPSIAQPDKMDWWKIFEGSYPVPRSIDVQRDPMAAIKNFEVVFGQGAYAIITYDPIGIEVHNFDTFIPTIRNEKAIYQAEVAF